MIAIRFFTLLLISARSFLLDVIYNTSELAFLVFFFTKKTFSVFNLLPEIDYDMSSSSHLIYPILNLLSVLIHHHTRLSSLMVHQGIPYLSS
jgi:hypothetical protein